jgi:NADPH-ferrihemoprotein reductase
LAKKLCLQNHNIEPRTAEEFASRLAKEGTRYGLKGVVADPEECDMEELTQVQQT